MAINTDESKREDALSKVKPKNCIDIKHGHRCQWSTDTLRCKRKNYGNRDLKMVRLDLNSEKVICEAFLVGYAMPLCEGKRKKEIKMGYNYEADKQ